MRTEQVFSKLLDAAPDAIVIVDSAGQIVLVNVQAERLFGWPRGELVGPAVEVLVPERYRAAHRGQRSGYFRQPGVRPMGAGLELHGLRRDGGEFPVEISLSPLPLDDGTLAMAAIRDISDRKHAQEALLRPAGVSTSSWHAVTVACG